jgi:hypothetical protein
MPSSTFRPYFRIETTLPPDEAQYALIAALKERNPYRFQSAIVKKHIVLSMHKSIRRFWSPQLDISISKDDGGETEYTLIRCLLGPASQVWTLFMFFYGFAGFALLVGLMIASTQYTLNYEMWGLYIALFGVVLGAAMFITAQVGKGIARAEMLLMKEFVESVKW